MAPGARIRGYVCSEGIATAPGARKTAPVARIHYQEESEGATCVNG
ncbi:hypothetical protein A2U01_0084642 [Trifolium medium]|uniref:Uncharacterized protein n=1 Tax=Trifolium medium TaxID=97028 RepID=A0A392TU70_9FABA|nr:hypothetical protein [Trifolium medium]